MTIDIIDDKHIHGKNLNDKFKEGKIDKKFFSKYLEYRKKIESITSLEDEDIKNIVKALNEYRKISIPVFDEMDNSGQKALGYTIMEEFFYLLFQKHLSIKNVDMNNMFLGKGNSYVSLSFAPKSFKGMFDTPKPYIHTKDQDFVLGATVDISVETSSQKDATTTVIPVIAIECKTYLERNMLDSCAATATRLKAAMPYCIYIVASQYLKMSDATPELTDIDEVYILCKAKNSDRENRTKKHLPPYDIDANLIIDLYKRVVRHLNAIWWNPEDAVTNGKIICRPI